ncbi:hypothetical protein N7462_005176 [Penicillium macrosclerotiorum]|uniref:uncharacterized protein n=1 Tax=Penicillium macrosclerotiorum TaxID=303699 RepID=UPI0025476528|nr:uncharacterized protein N7462_005176 [Penicillium macrosclerotiorum]KAJ5690784.1 hypothetical protein N7462_005176 [Penicillium macrosclerotiorum]
MANPTSGNWDDPGVLDSVLFASDALSNLSSAIFGQTTPDDMERAEIDDLVTGVVRNPGVHTSSLDCEPVIDNICLASDTTAVLDGDLDFQASTATNSGLINYWLIHDIALQMPANTIFRSLEEVRESQRQVMMLPQDNTIPQFANHEATLVSILVQAMESTDEAEDSLKVIKKFKKDQYTEATIEAVCWEILVSVPTPFVPFLMILILTFSYAKQGAMIYRHKGGGPLTAEGKGKPVGTFRERFDNMHRVLKASSERNTTKLLIFELS